MLSPEVRKKIRHLEIQTRRLLSSGQVGDSRSALKGSGFEFDQIREYQMGDDVRFIHWPSSLRSNKVLVKQYMEERNRTIILAVDISSSGLFSSSEAIRSDIMANIAGALALVADYGKDCVGLVLFSDTVELFIPPSKGSQHIHRIMKHIFNPPQQGKATKIEESLEYIARLPLKDVTIFVISDFINDDVTRFEKMIRIVGRRHDVVALRCLDNHEQQLPAIGLITIEDPETGQQSVMNINKHRAVSLNAVLKQRLHDQCSVFKKNKIDCVDIAINKPFMGELILFFRRRMIY